MRVYKIPPKKKRFNFKLSFTIQLIILNAVVFLVLSSLLSKGILSLDVVAINPSNILSGMYLWTFISSMFMHAGFFHLFVNMFSLIFVGSLDERLIGKKRYLYFYLIAGIFASLFFIASGLLFPSDFNAYAVGASGALFGLIGLLILLTPNLPVYIMFIPIPIKIKYAAPGILVLLWIISLAGNIPLGNFAHLGGLVIGLLYGLYLRKRFPKKIKYIQKRFS